MYYIAYGNMFQPLMLGTFKSLTCEKYVEELIYKIYIYTSCV